MPTGTGRVGRWGRHLGEVCPPERSHLGWPGSPWLLGRAGWGPRFPEGSGVRRGRGLWPLRELPSPRAECRLLPARVLVGKGRGRMASVPPPQAASSVAHGPSPVLGLSSPPPPPPRGIRGSWVLGCLLSPRVGHPPRCLLHEGALRVVLIGGWRWLRASFPSPGRLAGLQGGLGALAGTPPWPHREAGPGPSGTQGSPPGSATPLAQAPAAWVAA